ncbi:hypothetical protein BMS3Bbin07_01114 [bacterium BMS3Bbin07]|nr:hypothetical protein BMS3Bbin07_01114 [bacterium BMS3Bbin07]
MGKNVIKFPERAEKNIEAVLDEFLAEQRKRLKPRTVLRYEDVIELLKDHLNGYGHTGLSKVEAVFFDRYCNAEGSEHREFCRIFGPEKIIENMGDFLGYFMVRKVMAGADFKRSSGTVMKKLSKWLTEKGYISEESARDGVDEGIAAARDLPRAERAAEILYRASAGIGIDPAGHDFEDFMEFEQYTISGMEPGKLWVRIYEGGERATLGPVAVPESATSLLAKGWDISCALGKVNGKWRIVEMGNVYPL